ncbi:MAG: hypothetical protein IIB65_05380 [Proteobacteria bacterium]|nr:hypothetical protein [Pseudomonadota bacterium]MCH8095710.1 hypothetical protein [Pseudomonadota bacterium]
MAEMGVKRKPAATIAGHDGRIFATAGDSVVAEFASPVEAVCAPGAFCRVGRQVP